MSMEEYIRNAAKKSGWKKYYMVLRPVGIGTQPGAGMMDFINYDDRREMEGRMVWAEIYYDRYLTEKELEDYDMVKAKDMV